MNCVIFESAPVGINSGPFFNLVVSGETALPLAELFRALPQDIPLAIEAPKDHLRKSQSSLQRAKDVLEASKKLFGEV